MATASPSTVLAVPERPLPERPEPKGTDGSDGQFAGLMAHFTQPPPPPKADTQQQRQARSEREAPVKDSDDSSGVKGSQALKEKSAPKADAKDTRTDSVKAKPDPATPKPDPSGPPDGTKVPTDPTQAALEQPSAIQAALNQAAQAPLLAALALPQPSGKEEANTSKMDLALPPPTQPIELPPTPLAAAPPKLQAEPAKANPELQATPTPKLEVPTPISIPSLPPPTPPKVETTPQTDPTQPQPSLLSQAVLAESKTSTKTNPIFDETPSEDETSKTDASRLLEKATKAMEAPPAPRPASLNPAQASFQVTPQPSEQEAPLPTGKASAASATWIDPAPPTVDTTVAKAGLTAQTPLTRAADGSALAALSAGPRPMETPAPLAVAAPPPPPATPPTSPVIQVEGGIKWMLKGGVQEAQLQLHPESLGQVTIHLKVEGGEVHARLWVTEPTSVQAVQEGRSHLEMSLKEQGLQLGSFDLQQGHRPFQEAPSTPTYREQPAPELATTRQEAPSTILPSLLNPHHVELYA